MKLEEQIEKLSDLGLVLNPNVTPEDILLSYSREEYEGAPFDLILLAYGGEIEEEPWGRFVSDKAWNFDVEAIDGDGSYVDIVTQFHRITGKAKQIDNLRDRVDVENAYVELQYTMEGQHRSFKPVFNNDWADTHVTESVMSDLKQPGYNFYPKDNGQASVWFYLSQDQAIALNRLADNLFGLNRKPWWKVW